MASSGVALNTGAVLGINGGIFGSLGAAAAAVIAGWLMYLFGWRSAHIIPGIVVVITGIAFMVLLMKGVITKSKVDRKLSVPSKSCDETLKVYLILIVTMACGGLIYNATDHFAKGVALDFGADGDGVLTVSYLVGMVYLFSSILQLINWLCTNGCFRPDINI